MPADRSHRDHLARALELEAAAQRALLDGRGEQAQGAFAAAAEEYQSSWKLAPPASYGRLVGMLKAAIIAGDGAHAARYAREQLGGEHRGSPTAAYALALAALVEGDAEAASRFAEAMAANAAARPAGSEAFAHAATAIAAIARRDPGAYAEALEGIVRDFEGRSEHLTGVAIADTAVMLEGLARERGLTVAVRSPLLPAASGAPR